jgi:hypothetical protein
MDKDESLMTKIHRDRSPSECTHSLHREDHLVLPKNRLLDIVTPTLPSEAELPRLTII